MHSASAVDDAPDWMPESPDETMRLEGQLPSGLVGVSAEDAQMRVLRMMAQGQHFVQYYKAPAGALVKKQIKLVYVANAAHEAEGPGKLYWGERTDCTLSANRCLPLEKISEFYLGAQTTVLKQAFETGQLASTPAAGDNALFSLLSETTMLDLEALSVRSLCYWLWGLSILMKSLGRDVSETRDAAAEAEAAALLNCSRDRLNLSHDAGAMEPTNDELDALKRELLMDGMRRHTRKFSVAWGAGHAPVAYSSSSAVQVQGHNLLLDESAILSTSLNGSFSAASSSQQPSKSMQASVRAEAAGTLQAPLAGVRSGFSSMRQGINADLASFSSFFTASFKDLSAKASAAVKSQHAMIDSLAAEQKRRKVLQNKLIEIQGNIRVFARVRPSSAAENAAGDAGAVSFPGDNVLTLAADRDREGSTAKSFEFDRVFDQSSSQQDVFNAVAPFVQSAIDGFSICAFAYGQTGAGKSYTMEGNAADRGLNYRALTEVFECTAESNPKKMAGVSYKVSLAVVEIYNETIRDLLYANQKENRKLDIRQGADGIYIPDLTEVGVSSVSEVHNLLTSRAYPNRAQACTNMNAHSSRSHCVLFVKIVGLNARTHERTQGKLILIDLAGSERLNKSGAEGQALKEAQNINGSLSALGNVIQALQSKSAHIPYRNSKLTHLLSDCLGGQSKCIMFVQVSPALSSLQESSCSLQFAMRAKNTDLGQAKKNKSVIVAAAAVTAAAATAPAASAAAAAASSTAAPKESAAESRKRKDAESKAKAAADAELAKVQKSAKVAQEALQEANAQIQALQAQLKEAQAQRAQAAQAAAATLAQKEREWKDAQNKAVSDANKRKGAWEAEAAPAAKRGAAATSTSRASAPKVVAAAPIAADADAIDENDGGQENVRQAVAAAPVVAAGGSKKRKSGDAALEDCASKKQIVERYPSRIAAPVVHAASVLPTLAQHNAAATARTRKQVAGAPAAAAAVSRPLTRGTARPATAASSSSSSLLTSPQAVSGVFSPRPGTAAAARSASIPHLSFSGAPINIGGEPAMSDDVWQSHEVALPDAFTPRGAVRSMAGVAAAASPAAAQRAASAAAAASPVAEGSLSVTELARRKLEERRLKYKAERDLKKANNAAAATVGGWKM